MQFNFGLFVLYFLTCLLFFYGQFYPFLFRKYLKDISTIFSSSLKISCTPYGVKPVFLHESGSEKMSAFMRAFLRVGIFSTKQVYAFAVAAYRPSGVKPDFDSFTEEFLEILNVFAPECPFNLNAWSVLN